MSTESKEINSHSNEAEGHVSHDYIRHEKGFYSWWMTIDHKRLGLLYLASMFGVFIIAGLAALLVRMQLYFGTEGAFLSNTNYNRAFTAHGVMMVFLFIVPGIPATLGNFLLPLMIGAKDVAFPRMNRLSFWLFVMGALIALISVAGGLDTGWTFYTPYSDQSSFSVDNLKTYFTILIGTSLLVFSPALPIKNGKIVKSILFLIGLFIWGYEFQDAARHPNAGNQSHNVILLTTAAFILGFSSILTGINFLVTTHKMRCPGMKWDRMPLFVWTLYATAYLQIIATPIIGCTLILLMMENFADIGIFDPKKGGDSVLFQHFFWFYSHPVVYIMVLPAFGIISEIVPVFSRKTIFGYMGLVYATLGIAALSFVVWGHHMFVAGMSDLARYSFSFITFLVAIPTAIKVFNWVSTMYKASIKWDSPMLYAGGFVFLFMIAGCTGIHLATVALDAHYHDTYFVVAHFHYTMQGGTVIGLFAGLHYWFPLMFGRMYNETFAKFTWALIFIGFNGTFIPQFILGMMGMPRRYATYDALPEAFQQFQPLHQISTVFAAINGLGYSLVILHLLYMAFYGKKAPSNPFNSLSLEWRAALPPPHDNWDKIPTVNDWTYSYGKVEGDSAH